MPDPPQTREQRSPKRFDSVAIIATSEKRSTDSPGGLSVTPVARLVTFSLHTFCCTHCRPWPEDFAGIDDPSDNLVVPWDAFRHATDLSEVAPG